jgi:hypothetical protein
MKLFKILFLAVKLLFIPLLLSAQINYKAHRMDVYVDGKLESKNAVSTLFEITSNQIRTTNTENLKYLNVKSWDTDVYQLTDRTAQTLEIRATDIGNIEWHITMLYHERTDQTIFVIGQPNLNLMFYCKPTDERIKSDMPEQLPNHTMSNVTYSEEEIIEFFGMFGDPQLIYSLWMYDFITGK